jgi:hypothetical protein
MANVTVNDLTALASADSGDKIPIWDISAAAYKAITKANLFGATVTGGGTISTGGYTLTVPETMTAAGRNTANTFTKAQVVEPDTTAASAVRANMPASTSGSAFLSYYDSSLRWRVIHTATASLQEMRDFDNGSSVGPLFSVGRNNNGSTPAAGSIELLMRDGSTRYLWVDNTGDLRIHSSQPTNATDTSGTVVGTQS